MPKVFFQKPLCFDKVGSIDFSDYEGAAILHDISNPVSQELVTRFDLTIDGGTLEHVFNFPVGVANLMRLTKTGGFCDTQSPCNNIAGKGFYQFSPELIFRMFFPENGFRNEFVGVSRSRTVSAEQTPHQKLYEVFNPMSVGSRVTPLSLGPFVMMTLGERTDDREPFQQSIMQSDYSAKWVDDKPDALNWKGRIMESLACTSCS